MTPLSMTYLMGKVLTLERHVNYLSHNVKLPDMTNKFKMDSIEAIDTPASPSALQP